MKRITTMWGIECPGSKPYGAPWLYPILRNQRNQAVREITENYDETWAALKKRGFRAIKVLVYWTASQ